MKPAPRTLRLLAAAALVCATAAPASATQRPTPRPPAPAQKSKGARGVRDTKDAKGAKDSKDAKARERQSAVAALLEAFETARACEHAGDRVSLQADAADALWPLDAPAARSLLRRAWEFTTDPNAPAAFRPEEEGGRFGPRELILSARHHIITRAAKHDAAMAEEFMQEFERGLPAEEDVEPTGTGPWGRGAGREASALNTRRLWAANSLLDEGAHESAAAVAAPAVADGPNIPLLRFLLRLRAFGPDEADALYLRLLGVTRADASADANDVLLLSSPVVSPEVIALVEPDGSTYLAPAGRSQGDPPAATPASARARRAFYDTAAAVLLRQPAARDEAGAPRALANYFAVGRLLPHFEREAPQHVAPLRARLAGLVQEVDEARRAALSAQMNVEKLTPRNPPDPLQPQTDAISRADDAGRDGALFDAASAAALRRLWERGRKFAGEIADPKTRRAAFLFIALRQVSSAGEAFRDEDAADDFERAAAFVRGADVPAAARAYGLAQAAELAARKGKKKRAAELFDEAAGAAASVDRGTATRVALLSLLAESAARSEPARAWGLLAELAAAVNEQDARPRTEEAADDPCAGVTVETSENAYCVELSERVPEPEEVFAALARLDLARALTEARSLKGPYRRASALIHAARVVNPVRGRDAMLTPPPAAGRL